MLKYPQNRWTFFLNHDSSTSPSLFVMRAGIYYHHVAACWLSVLKTDVHAIRSFQDRLQGTQLVLLKSMWQRLEIYFFFLLLHCMTCTCVLSENLKLKIRGSSTCIWESLCSITAFQKWPVKYLCTVPKYLMLSSIRATLYEVCLWGSVLLYSWQMFINPHLVTGPVFWELSVLKIPARCPCLPLRLNFCCHLSNQILSLLHNFTVGKMEKFFWLFSPLLEILYSAAD